jgi:hypothetical protein
MTTTDPYELIQELSVYDLVELRNKLVDTYGHEIREAAWALFDDQSLPELTYSLGWAYDTMVLRVFARGHAGCLEVPARDVDKRDLFAEEIDSKRRYPMPSVTC